MSNPLALVLGLTPWSLLPVIACVAVSLSAVVVISAHLVSGPSDLDATPETAAERYARRDVRVDEPDDLPQPNSASRSRFLTRGWGHGR